MSSEINDLKNEITRIKQWLYLITILVVPQAYQTLTNLLAL